MAKDSCRSVLFMAGALALCTMTMATPADAAVGRTASNFSVSNSGSAQYSIPIFAPRGPKALQPNIALVYSSAGGKGYLGRGWSLGGFSSIGRCNLSLAQDAKLSGAVLSKSSGYCLDGNRLRLYSGTYGESGSVYATEIADFSRITANGGTGPGNLGGPESWVVERMDGTIHTYGGTSDSRVSVSTYPSGTTPRAWRLSKIEDRYGNKILFSYKSQDSATSGTTHPTAIYWTQTSEGSGSYVYSMEFSYNDTSTNTLPTSLNGVVHSNTIRETDLLTSISVKVSGTVVRKYALGYETSPTTGGKRLVSVTECSDASQTDCLAPTTIAYQNGQAGIDSTPTFIISGSIDAVSGRFDLNGDGLRDLVYRRSSYLYVRFASTSGYGSEVSTGVGSHGVMAGDPFGNGRDVLMAPYGGTWYAYIWNGSSFSAASTGVPVAYAPEAISLADVDGDGRDDIVAVQNTEYMDAMSASAYRSTSTGSTLSFDTEGVGSTYTPTPPEEGGYLA